MKKSLVFVFLLVFGVLMSGVVSADVFIGPTESFYHLGDELNFTVTLGPLANANDFLSVKMICVVPTFVSSSTGNESENNESSVKSLEGLSQSEVEIYKSPYSVKAGAEKKIDISAKLDKFLVGDLRGICTLRANYNGEEANSKEFEINRELEVDAVVSGVVFLPGDNVGIKGSAYRLNGVPVEGFAEATISGAGVSVSGVVGKGEFELNFSILKDMPAGKYKVVVRAYEKDENGEIINEGFSEAALQVEQVIRKVEISFESSSVTPGSDFSYSVNLYDQAGSPMAEDVTINIYKPDKSEFSEELVRAGEKRVLKTTNEFEPGYWEVTTQIGELERSKIFLVENLELASFVLEDNRTLVVTNIGNVRYKKPVEIRIGGVSEVRELDLDLGEVKKFKLSAPDGSYKIEINDGNIAESLGTTFLTGRAIGISGAGLLSGLKEKFFLLVWIFAIAIAGIIAFILYRKIRNKAYFEKTPQLVRSVGVDTQSPKKKLGLWDVKEKENDAISSSVIEQGVRQECSVVSLNLKNLREVYSFDKEVIKSIDKGLFKAKDANAKIYVSGDYRIMIFCPVMTGEADNNVRAINSAKYIGEVLNEYNVGHDKKLDYGIGVNIGDMIIERKEGKFRFSSVGNTISLVKGISVKSTGDVLISKNVHNRVVGKVKSEKHPGEDYWIVKSVSDRGKYSGFVERYKTKS